MQSFVALLRAVNVGGTGKLPMSDLKAMCEQIGCLQVQTYIASGNVVFLSEHAASGIKMELETRLEAYAGKPIAVILRTAEEMAAVFEANPFKLDDPRHTVAIFLDQPPSQDLLKQVAGLSNEKLRLGKNEIYVHYPDGMARSRLKIPAASSGTARNMNTIARISKMASLLSR